MVLSDPTPSFRHDYIDSYNSTLLVPGLRLKDVGQYRCRVDPVVIGRGTPDISTDLDLAVLPGEKGLAHVVILYMRASQ